MRKIPFAGVELTSQRVKGLRGTSELPGRPYLFQRISFILSYLILDSMVSARTGGKFLFTIMRAGRLFLRHNLEEGPPKKRISLSVLFAFGWKHRVSKKPTQYW